MKKRNVKKVEVSAPVVSAPAPAATVVNRLEEALRRFEARPSRTFEETVILSAPVAPAPVAPAPVGKRTLEARDARPFLFESARKRVAKSYLLFAVNEDGSETALSTGPRRLLTSNKNLFLDSALYSAEFENEDSLALAYATYFGELEPATIPGENGKPTANPRAGKPLSFSEKRVKNHVNSLSWFKELKTGIRDGKLRYLNARIEISF
jgi:hypothetical protein